MPKIGKDHVTIHGKQVELEVHYSRKTKFHYKGLPEEIYHMRAVRAVRQCRPDRSG